MPIAFRCTRCRSRLHVPQRWQGTSVACPKCSTRVMVPAESAAGPTGFEHRDVEKSLAALEASPGGIFSTESFELPEATAGAVAEHPSGGGPAGRAGVGTSGVAGVPANAPNRRMKLPRWAIYASMVSYMVVAAIGFALGWIAASGGTWR